MNDSTGGIASTFWKGTSVCASGGLLTLNHALQQAVSCSDTTITANITSVEVPVYTSELSMVPTTSNNGDTVGCFFPLPDDLVFECTLDVLCELL